MISLSSENYVKPVDFTWGMNGRRQVDRRDRPPIQLTGKAKTRLSSPGCALGVDGGLIQSAMPLRLITVSNKNPRHATFDRS